MFALENIFLVFVDFTSKQNFTSKLFIKTEQNKTFAYLFFLK